MLGMRFPTPYLGHARLKVTQDALKLRSTPPRLWGTAFANLRDDLTWDIPVKRIVQVETCEIASPVGAKFDMTFIQVQTGELGLAGKFLMRSAARKYSLEGQQRDTAVLFTQLHELASLHGWASGAHA
jgi:hypothetical protein